ncbi:hypothetical protein PHYBOEH_005320 [Phytophthora boehmeriae]|uniref:Tetratricopeptide repeat protein n=1 Tax=Phytophthora boehmeriae TaxID=109152 RepID=A0A8T1XAS6_9STRA|nr:hypothetical protein PHYBOEH_005320 [Phytophthora boehmeriae]
MPTDKIDSDNAQWHARLATLLTASGKHDSAASHYQRALRGLDEAAYSETQKRRLRLQWQFDLAATETKRGERQKAIDLYETILLVDPTCVEAKRNWQ